MVLKKHSDWSASASERWLGCPGSVALCKKAPPTPESPYAKEGTDAHQCLEDLLAQRPIGSYPAEMQRHAREAVAAIDERWSRDAALRSEYQVTLSHIHAGMFGTVDVAICEDFGRLTVIDYKYGAGVAVSPSKNGRANPQLAYYAVGLAQEVDWNISEISLVIIQPRAEHPDGPIREYRMSVEELREWEKTFRDGVEATKKPSAPLVPDESGGYCRWCPAKAICPALSTNALSQAQADFAPDTGALVLPDPATVLDTPEKLGLALSACERLDVWITEIRAHAHARLTRGDAVAGYKLVDKRATRRWADVPNAVIQARRQFGKKAFTTDLLSPAQLEKLGPKAVKFVEKHAAAISSGTVVAPESDSRPAVNQAQKDFSPVMVTGEEITEKPKNRRNRK